MGVSLRAMRARVVGLVVVAAVSMGVGGCGDDETDPSVDLTFYLQPQVEPAAPVDGQTHRVAWTLFNADQRSDTARDVAWTLERDGVVVASGTVPALRSRDRVPLSLDETLAPGTYQYRIAVDPANAIAELNEDDNVRTLTVVVLPLSVM